jgi:predicted nucleotidyltransferase
MKKKIQLDDKIAEVVNKVKDKAGDIFGDKLIDVILFGSYARGEQSSESDLDIMLVLNMSSMELKKFRDTIVDIEVDLSLEYDIVLSIMLQSEFEFKKYDKVLPFFINVLNEGVSI